MINNRSPHWPEPNRRKSPSDQPERHEELFAVLGAADVSEPLRAAVAHALKPVPGEFAPTDYADALVNRYLGERDGGGNQRRYPPLAGHDPRGRYTLHLTFPAGSLGAARAKALAYAEGLTVLRPELGADAPLLSRADAWNHIEPLHCGATGPEGEACTGRPGHLGCHRVSGNDRLCWGGHDSAPENP